MITELLHTRLWFKITSTGKLESRIEHYNTKAHQLYKALKEN